MHGCDTKCLLVCDSVISHALTVLVTVGAMHLTSPEGRTILSFHITKHLVFIQFIVQI